MVISGKVIELYEYENGYLKGYQDKTGKTGRLLGAESENKVDNRIRAMSKAKVDIRRLINSNSDVLTIFLTLTFKENVTDLDYCHNEFKKYIKRLKYNYRKNEI